MPNSWPLLVLLPPLVVTLSGGRSAWLWLSLVAGVAVLLGLVQYVLLQFAQGNIDTIFRGLLESNGPTTALHDTYYVVANFNATSIVLIPALIVGALLFIRAHPRRAAVDIALFWACVALFLLSVYGVNWALGAGMMPRRYVDYGQIQLINYVFDAVTFVAACVVAFAAFRPIRSWWTSRKINDAV